MALKDSVMAFGIPIPLEVWAAESTLGESTSRAGIPVASERDDGSYPDWVLSAAGQQTTGTTIEVQCIEPGYPPLSGVAVREDSETVWRGRDTPLMRERTDALQAGGGPSRYAPHGIALPSGARVVAFTRQIAGGAYSVVVAYRSASATSWSTVDVVTGLSTTAYAYPCLVVLDRGIQLYHWFIDDDNDEANIDVYQSLDDGATWRRSASAVLPSAISTTTYTLKRIRAAYRQGQTLLLVHKTKTDAGADPREYVGQYASADGGAHFSSIVDVSYLAFPDIAVYDGRFVCVFANESTTFLEARFIANAYAPLDTTPADSTFIHNYNAMVPVTTNVITDCDHALAVSESGLYWLARSASTAGSTEQSCQIIRLLGAISDQNIANMGRDASIASGYGAWWIQDAAQTATDYPKNFCAWFWRGSIQVAYNLESSSNQWDDQILLSDLGGNSSVVMPPAFRIGTDAYQSSFKRHYIASSLPTVARYGWTAVGAGTSNITTTAGWLYVSTAANQRYYTWTRTNDAYEVRFSLFMRRVSGGAVGSDDIACGLRLAQAGLGFEVRLRVTSTGVRLYDVNGASVVASVTMTTTDGVYMLLALDETGKCFAAAAAARSDGARVYEVLSNGGTVTDDLGAGGTDNVWTFGNVATGTAVSEWSDVSVWYSSSGTAPPGSLAAGQDNPDDLKSIPLSASAGSYAGEGVSIRARGARMMLGDTWTIPADAGSPQRALHPRGSAASTRAVRCGDFPSPRSGAIATATTGRWAFRLPSAAEQRFPRGGLLVDIQGANFETVLIEGYASAAWSTIGTWAGRVASLSFAREGTRIRPNAASSTYFRTNELIGGYVKLVSGLTTVVRPILRNTGGIWTTSSTSPIPVIDIDPDAYTGTEPASGTLTVYYGRGTLFIPLAVTAQYSAFAARFQTAPSTYEAYPQAGKIGFYEAWMMDSADWGASRVREYGALIEEADNGATRAKVLRPSRDVRELPFTRLLVDGMKTSAVWTIETGGANVMLTGAESEVLEGVLEELEQGVIPGVYVPYIASDGGARTLVSDLAGVYGRPVMEEMQFTLEHGDEGSRTVSGGRLIWRGEL